MAKAEVENSDGLEIVSIGTIYSGTWDKKYWSSSRGKDRYPFPVGYKAVRTHNGITYQMEIHEGSQGPSFSITSTDGQSCSGQTPDMAWEIFQRKGYPRIKLWRGKRFSCKIDGAEFFGFKNAFVQRLLRELVTHGDVTVQRGGSASSSIKGDSATKLSIAESCSDPAYLTNSEKPPVKGKRGRRPKSFSSGSLTAANSKKIRPQDEVLNNGVSPKGEVHNDGISYSGKGSQNNHNYGTSHTRAASSEVHAICNNIRAPAVSMSLEAAVEGKIHPFPVEHNLHVESCHTSDHQEEIVTPKESKVPDSFPTGTTEKLSRNINSPCRSVIKIKDSRLLMSETFRDGEVSVVKDTQGTNDIDLCVPDTLDFLHDTPHNSHSYSQQEIQHDRKCELNAENITISENMESEPRQGEDTSTSNADSGKSDFDSVSEDVTKSMMTFLLPQAIPLLKTFSRKKRRVLKSPENCAGREPLQEEHKGTDHRDIVSCQGVHTTRKEMERVVLPHPDQGSNVFSLGCEAIVTSDSVISDQARSDDQADLPSFDDNRDILHIFGPPSVDISEEAAQSASIFRDQIYTEQEDLLERPNKDIISESVFGCLSFTEENTHTNINDLNRIPGEYVCSEIYSKEKELEALPNHDKETADKNPDGLVTSRKDSHKETCLKTLEVTTDSSLTEGRPLSESIICRSSVDDFAPGMYAASKRIVASNSYPISSTDHVVVLKTDPVVSKCETFVGHPNNKVKADLDPSAPSMENFETHNDRVSPVHQNRFDECNISPQKPGTSSSSFARKVIGGSWLKPEIKIRHRDEPASDLHFVGRYVLPLPVSFVLLSTKEEELNICVLCGASINTNRELFVYKVSTTEQTLGCPSFIGHTSLLLPLSRDAFLRELSMDRTCLQFTPEGHSLVLSNSVKAPYCRAGDLQCPCSACRSSCTENQTLKVVQVKRGYTSVVMSIGTAQTVNCILVCEPNYLVGVEENGKLHLWVMNSTWSALIEECDLSTSDCIFPCIVELKRIPNNATLIVGHNGFGEFGVWDVCKRIFIARFSSPSTSVFQFLPVSALRWQTKGSIFAKFRSHGTQDITEIMASTKRSFSKQGDNHAYNPIQGDDVGIWLLVSTICNVGAQQELQSSDHKMNPGGLWRLALLAENRVILGSALDHRAAAIGASAGDGVIGTSDGVVYMWDLSTGTKICDLQHLQGGAGISCIATYDSPLRPLAIAGGNQLQVYLHSQKGIVSSAM